MTARSRALWLTFSLDLSPSSRTRCPTSDRSRAACTHKREENSAFLDLFAEYSWRNVYAGDLEVPPPWAPTIHLAGRLSGVLPRVGQPETRRWRRADLIWFRGC